MRKYTSFEQYLEGNYYDEIRSAIAGLITKRGRNNGFYSHTLLDCSYLQVTGVSVKSVSFSSTDGNRILFNAAVKADVVLKGLGKRDYNADSGSLWYTVSFTGYLSGGLHMVTITGANEYLPEKFDKDTTLSKYLVPYLYSEDLEKEAEKFLLKYYRQALKEPMPILLDELLLNMGLELYEAPLPNNIFGKTFFAEAVADVFIYDGGVESRNIDPGTILLNPDIPLMRNLGARNNAIVHECVHWDRHGKFFELQKLLNGGSSALTCKIVEQLSEIDTDIGEAIMWVEWQASALAPRILMPLEPAKFKAEELVTQALKDFSTAKVIDVMEPVIEGMATFFGVSKQAAKIRLYELGYEEAAGTFIYLDGRYVKPHTFKKGFLKSNQTFSISFRDAMVASFVHPELRAAKEQGLFLFVDSHFCINNSKYITYDGFGNPHLTDYARYHMDECCLVFDLSIDSPANSYQKEFFWECVLCRDVNSDIVFVANYGELDQNRTVQERAKTMAAYNQEISSVLHRLPSSFPDALLEIMRWREITVEGLAEAANLSPKTIQRLRNDPDYVSSLETVVSVCIGLKLPPILSRALIGKSGFSLKGTETHVAYDFLLTGYYTSSIFDCNEMLVAQNIPPLGERN
jgi:hypothetical protein